MRDLTLCPECRRDFVYPVEWEEVDALDWEVELRCGNCGWWEIGTFDQATVDAFDDKLDDQTDSLVETARMVEHANFASETARFAAALDAGAILPEDFR